LNAVECELNNVESELKYLHSLAGRTNGRAYATVLRLSVCLSVVCDVMYCG